MINLGKKGRWVRTRKKPVYKEKTEMQKMFGEVARYCKKLRESGETDKKQYECIIETWEKIKRGENPIQK